MHGDFWLTCSSLTLKKGHSRTSRHLTKSFNKRSRQKQKQTNKQKGILRKKRQSKVASNILREKRRYRTYGRWQRGLFPGGASGLRKKKKPACQHRRHKRCRFEPWVRKMAWRRAWQPLQYCCLENPIDRGAWRATVYSVAQIQTRLKWLSTRMQRGLFRIK